MIALFSLSLFETSSSNKDILNYIKGKWTGRLTHSESLESATDGYVNITADITKQRDATFASIIIKSNDESIYENYFLKLGESCDELILSSRFDEDITTLKVHGQTQASSVSFRGVLPPKNDQISFYASDSYLLFTITDQFTDNITMILLDNRQTNDSIPILIRSFVFIVTGAVICFGLYKASDLTDVIKPDEAEYTKMAKAKSLLDDERKKYEKKKKEYQKLKEKAEREAENKKNE